MRATLLLSLAILAVSRPNVGAADRIVHQSGRMFSVATLTVARGEQVVFLNDDTVPHNVMSTARDNAFDFGSQPSGTSTPVSFDQAGEVTVLCAIHPRMRLVITVED